MLEHILPLLRFPLPSSRREVSPTIGIAPNLLIFGRILDGEVWCGKARWRVPALKWKKILSWKNSSLPRAVQLSLSRVLSFRRREQGGKATDPHQWPTHTKHRPQFVWRAIEHLDVPLNASIPLPKRKGNTHCPYRRNSIGVVLAVVKKRAVRIRETHQ